MVDLLGSASGASDSQLEPAHYTYCYGLASPLLADFVAPTNHVLEG